MKKSWFLALLGAPLGGLATPGSPFEPHKYEVPVEYDTISFQLFAYGILTSDIKRYGFFSSFVLLSTSRGPLPGPLIPTSA